MTNDQLAEMVRRNVCSPEELRTINGIGDARIEKYGAQLLAVMTKEKS